MAVPPRQVCIRDSITTAAAASPAPGESSEFFNSDYYLTGASGLVLSVDFTTWGWLHLGIGVVSVAAGFGLLAGNMAARVVAVAFAMLSAIAIFAVVVHGRELKA